MDMTIKSNSNPVSIHSIYFIVLLIISFVLSFLLINNLSISSSNTYTNLPVEFTKIAVNKTPTVGNNKINIEFNNQKGNKLGMKGEVYITGIMDDTGYIVESTEEVRIASIPLLRPGEQIKFIDTVNNIELKPGRYEGKVVITQCEEAADTKKPNKIVSYISITVI